MNSLQLQERDFELLRGLLDSRVMALAHAAALYFGGRVESAKKRVQKLKADGYVGERARKTGDPSILHLTKKAFLALRDHGHLPQGRRLTWEFLEKRPRVSDLTLRHELEVMDVKAAFCTALAQVPALSLQEFTTWPMFYQFAATVLVPGYGRREMMVKPDGFIRFHEQDAESVFEHTFFLEVDRSTETQDTLVQKTHGYLDFYKTGGFASRMGHRAEEFRDFPFRVLLVVKNEERRNNAAERLLTANPPILTQVWMTTAEEMLSNPMGAIWVRPKDYLAAVEGTAFNPGTRKSGAGYRRQSERETMVRERISKVSLTNP